MAHHPSVQSFSSLVPSKISDDVLRPVVHSSSSPPSVYLVSVFFCVTRSISLKLGGCLSLQVLCKKYVIRLSLKSLNRVIL